MTVSTERLITVKEASEILNVPRSWVYAKVESVDCDVPHFRVGRYIRFRASELDVYLEQQRGGPRP